MEGSRNYGALSNPEYVWKGSALLRKDIMVLVLSILLVHSGIIILSWKNMDTWPFSGIIVCKGVVEVENRSLHFV